MGKAQMYFNPFADNAHFKEDYISGYMLEKKI